MKPEKSKFLFRNIFIVLASLGLLANIVFDYISYQENKISDRLGELVINSYNLQLKLEKIKTTVLNSSSKNKYSEIRKSLSEINKDQLNTESLKLLKQIETVENNTELITLINKIYDNQANSLGFNIEQDLKQDREMEASMIRTLALDFSLITILMIVFILSIKNRLSIEKNLKNTVTDMREMLLALEEENFKRKVSIKTTVHDLKNPIGSILGFAQILAEEPSLRTSVAQFSERIQKISQRSLELVESMLKIDDNPPVEMSSLNLVRVIQDICTQLEVQANIKNQILKKDYSDKNVMIHANQMKMEELLANLISNAIKYSPKGSKIKIRCFPTSGYIRTEIHDEGPGFNHEDKIHAFQYGQKLSAKPTDGESSTGFGLFMAKQIVDLHRGKIEITDSVNGKGACIYFEIPSISF